MYTVRTGYVVCVSLRREDGGIGENAVDLEIYAKRVAWKGDANTCMEGGGGSGAGVVILLRMRYYPPDQTISS